jgi:hypothetical protein
LCLLAFSRLLTKTQLATFLIEVATMRNTSREAQRQSKLVLTSRFLAVADMLLLDMVAGTNM